MLHRRLIDRVIHNRMMVIVEINRLSVHLTRGFHVRADFLRFLLVLTVKGQCGHSFGSGFIRSLVGCLQGLPISLILARLTDLFNLNFLSDLFHGKFLLHWLSLDCRLGFFLDFLDNRFLGVSSSDYLLQFCYLVQFLGCEVQVAFDAQPVYLDFLHLIERHIAQLPAVAHCNGTEPYALLGVVLQKISRVSSHREEIACVSDLVANKFLSLAV